MTADAIVWHGHRLSGSYSDDACRKFDPPVRSDLFHEEKLSRPAERALTRAGNADNEAYEFTTEQKRLRLKDFTKIPNGTGGVKNACRYS
jgi:hypothetical protein